MENTPLSQSELNNENVFNEECEKLFEKLFENKTELKTDDISTKLEKIYPHHYKMNLDAVNAFDTKFTWANILRAIRFQGSFLTKVVLRNELKKQI